MLAKTVTLDFETYFDQTYSLSKLTYPEYVHDARFHIHGVGLRHPDGRCEFAWDAAAAIASLQQQYGEHLEAVTVIFHNGHFDGYVLAQRFKLVPRFTLDTLHLAHAIYGRRGEGGADASLGALAERLGLPAKGDITSLLGVRNLSPQQRLDLEQYAINDVRNTFAVAAKLLPELSRPAVELRVMAHTTLLHNARGFPVDVAAIQPLINAVKSDTITWYEKAGITAEQAGTTKQFNELLATALARTGRKLPLKQGKTGQIPATAKTDAEMQDLLEDDDEVVASLARARLALGSETQLVARLETLKRITAATGGVLPVHLVYGGASTGRFAGGGRFNIQNLPRGGFGRRIRQLFVPLPGHTLVVIDLSQIEARVTASLAGEQALISAFREGIDIYCVEASAVFGREVRKPVDADPPELAKLLDGMRQTGKQECLGLGFQMGALKFMNTLLKDPKTAPLFNSGVLTAARCVEIVKRFRGQYSAIPVLWGYLQAAFTSMVTHGGSTHVGPLRFVRVDDRVDIHLPSGRILRYPQARQDQRSSTIEFLDIAGDRQEFTVDGPSLLYGEGKGINLYGGKLTENIVQAIARDIMVEAMLRAEARGAFTLAHVHDEVIAMAPKDSAEQVKAILMEEFTRPVRWMADLPLAADAKLLDRYTK